MPAAEIQGFVNSILPSIGLSPAAEDGVAERIRERLWLLERRLDKSPYAHWLSADDQYLSFAERLQGWVGQFPTTHRLGAALLGLSCTYLSETEHKNLLRHLCARAAEYYHSFPDEYKWPLAPFALSGHAHQYAEFIAGCAITNDAKRETVLSDFIAAASVYIRDDVREPTSTQGRSGLIYEFADEWVPRMWKKQILVFDDWSISGTRLFKVGSRLCRLCQAVFRGPVLTQGIPSIAFAFPVATTDTLAAVSKLKEQFSDIRIALLTGCVFDCEYAIGTQLPPIQSARIADLIGRENALAAVRKSLDWFATKYGAECGARYLQRPNDQSPSDFAKYGFGNRGWLVVGHLNCPNNAPPCLWFAPNPSFVPLFPRKESNDTSIDDDAMNAIKEVESLDVKSRIEAVVRETEGRHTQATLMRPRPRGLQVSGEHLASRVLGGRESGKITVTSMSFEGRCRRLMGLITTRGLDAGQMMTLENGDARVPFQGARLRSENAQAFTGALRSSLDDILGVLRSISKDEQKRIVWLDGSAMPRVACAKMLLAMHEGRPRLDRCYFSYAYPSEYVDGEYKLTAPSLHRVFDPPLRSVAGTSLLLFPGFDASETSTFLAAYVNGGAAQVKRIQFAFSHPGFGYAAFDRAVSAHSWFLDGGAPDERHVEMPVVENWVDGTDAESVIRLVFAEAQRCMAHRLALIVGVMGPRSIIMPVVLAVRALRAEPGCVVDVVFAQTMAFRSIRSTGEGSQFHAWRLGSTQELIDEQLNALRKGSAVDSNRRPR